MTLWASLGPRAGLYTLLYRTIPVFSFLRAPERMGIVVVLCLAIFAAFGVRELRRRLPGARAGHCRRRVRCGAARAERRAVRLAAGTADSSRPTALLARVPRGPVAEFPFYDRRIDFHIHTSYMLNSTAHWQPLLNGYSDYIPADFRTLATTLATFPSASSFDALKDRSRRATSRFNRGRQGYGAADVAGHRTAPAAVPSAPAGRSPTSGQLVIYESSRVGPK